MSQYKTQRQNRLTWHKDFTLLKTRTNCSDFVRPDVRDWSDSKLERTSYNWQQLEYTEKILGIKIAFKEQWINESVLNELNIEREIMHKVVLLHYY